MKARPPDLPDDQYDWLLEYDNDGDVYTEGTPTEETVERALKWFDGSSTFYCCLSDCADDSCLWCYGEPDRRVIEGRLDSGPNITVCKSSPQKADKVRIKYGSEIEAVVDAPLDSVLADAEVIAVFLGFFRTHGVPPPFRLSRTSILFGETKKE